jgi:hypothetical protein
VALVDHETALRDWRLQPQGDQGLDLVIPPVTVPLEDGGAPPRPPPRRRTSQA